MRRDSGTPSDSPSDPLHELPLAILSGFGTHRVPHLQLVCDLIRGQLARC